MSVLNSTGRHTKARRLFTRREVYHECSSFHGYQSQRAVIRKNKMLVCSPLDVLLLHLICLEVYQHLKKFAADALKITKSMDAISQNSHRSSCSRIKQVGQITVPQQGSILIP